MRGGKRIQTATDDEILRLVVKGYSTKDITTMLRVGRGRVARVMAGEVVEPSSSQPTVTDEQVVEAINAGKTTGWIRSNLGVGHERVMRLRLKHDRSGKGGPRTGRDEWVSSRIDRITADPFTVRHIMDACDYSGRSAADAVAKSLIDKGIITRIHRGGGPGNMTLYRRVAEASQ